MNVVLAYGIGEAPAARGHVVVIDVLRAFTCAAFALSHGAESIVLVSTTDEAFAVKRARPDALLMGEIGGRLIPGFDLGNSPHELVQAGTKGLLRGRTIVQRTGSGTQGVVAAKHADAVYLGSLPVASATCRHLRKIGAETVTLLAMSSPSGDDGPEDLACRAFMADVLAGREPNRERAIRDVRESIGGRRALDPAIDWTVPGDLACATDVDRFDFAMAVSQEDGLLVARSVEVPHPDRLDDRLPFDVQAEIALRRSREMHPSSIPRLAGHLIDLGCEHPALFDLCGLTSFDPRWAGDRLDEAIVALGLAPDDVRMRLTLCVETARQIVVGEITPEQGASRICSLSHYGYEFGGADRRDWYSFDDDLWDANRFDEPRTPDGWRARLRRHARHIVERYGPPSLTV